MMAANAKSAMGLAVCRGRFCRDGRRLADPCQAAAAHRLPWQVDHFLVYFAATSIFCLASPRPFVGAGSLMASAAPLEALQGLTLHRVPDLPTALSGAAGALLAALLAKLVLEARKGRASANNQACTPEPQGAGAARGNLMYP